MGQLPIDHGRVYTQQSNRGIMSTMVKFLSIERVHGSHGGVLVADYSEPYSEVLFNPQSGLARPLGAISGTRQQRCNCLSSRNDIEFWSLGGNCPLARKIGIVSTRRRVDASSTES